MKKIFLFVFSVCLMLACAGCDSGEISEREDLVETSDVPVESVDSSSKDGDLLTYFNSDVVAGLTEITNISDFDLSTSLLDEGCEHKPIAVLFFDVDSIEKSDVADDYYEKVNNGGCIEIFEDGDTASNRNNYLTGYFFFGLSGGKHDVVSNYVIQMSEKLSNKEQKNMIDQLMNILTTSGDEDADSYPDDSSNQESDEATKHEDIACAPDDWTNLLEKHYEEVKKQFEDAGFTNITCVAHEIDYDENNVFEGSVVNIAIGEDGEICTFDKGEQWAKDIEIRIDYRVKPKDTTSQPSTDSNPYHKVEDYSVYTENEYAHIDSDVIRLGNDERAWITIEASPASLTMDDFIVDYDDTMIEIVDITSSTLQDMLQIEITITAKNSGVSDIIICSGYELYEDAENATCYVLTVNGLNSNDGRVVYVTSSGEKYHFSASCVESGIETTLSDALAYEYEPCGKCVG